MTDSELADEIIARLNKLIEDPAVRQDVETYLETRILCSDVTYNHASIQTEEDLVGFLGFLNGFIGCITAGPRKGWGYIAAVYGTGGETLVRFERTDSAEKSVA